MTNASGAAQIALVHEWIEGRTGSEKVFEALAEIWPSADLYALTSDPMARLEVGQRVIRTTFLDRGWARDRRNLTLPIMPIAWRTMRASKYDLVIASHHAFSSSSAVGRLADRHLAYVHTPARYIWSPELDSRGTGRLSTLAAKPLRVLDRRSAQHLDSIAVNSREVQGRVQKYWQRDAKVIYPPVDTEFYHPGGPAPSHDRELGDSAEPFLLAAGRLVHYKRMDRAIRAAELADMPLIIAGRGPEEHHLRELASAATVPVKFVIGPDDNELRRLMQLASCLLFFAHEDFGILPVEVQACGTPVLALNVGGTAESVVNGRTGSLLEEFTDAAVRAGISTALGCDPGACVEWAQTFARPRFLSQIRDWADTQD